MPAYFRPLAATAFLAALAVAVPAGASTISIANTTWVESYNGASPSAWFPSSDPYWGQNIGEPTYQTTGVTISMSNANTMEFQFATGFNGNDTTYDTPGYGNVVVGYADIFLTPTGGGPQYAIVLGDETDNGGLSTAGVYQVTSFETSQDIWKGRTQFIYGGQYAPNAAGNVPDTAQAMAAPTVVTGGSTYLAGAGASPLTVNYSYTAGELDVTLTANQSSDFGFLLSDYDLFWGTGDCSNAPLSAEVDSPILSTERYSPVPEPGSLALLAAALGGLGAFRCRRSYRA